MTDRETQAFNANNGQSLRKLARAIMMSQGHFALILVCCKFSPKPLSVLNQLQDLSSLPIQGVMLHPSVDTLFTAILTSLDEPPPSALVVFGLDSVVAIDQLLSATNMVREEFRKQFPFPLVLWIDDRILQKMIRLAPDFKSWGANPIRLEYCNHQTFRQTYQMACAHGK